jgi:hypothetical protein
MRGTLASSPSRSGSCSWTSGASIHGPRRR